MIKIQVYYISRPKKDFSDSLCEEFLILCSNFNVKLEFLNLFSKTIKQGQTKEVGQAQKCYTKAFMKAINPNTYKIALMPNAKTYNSLNFAKILANKNEIAFCIGGAYGLELSFAKSCDLQLSLSPLTFSHKIAKVILSEQIYRAFCLLNNHPYHK